MSFAVERERERRQRVLGSRGDGDDRDDERADDRSRADAACEAEHADDGCAQQHMPPQIGGRRALRLEIAQRAALLAQVADDREQQADRGERQADERRHEQQRDRASRERVARQLVAPARAATPPRAEARTAAARRARAPTLSQRPARPCSPQ